MPVFCSFPEEHLAFYKAVAFFQGADRLHLFLCQRILCHAFQIICIVMYREGNRDLASLVSPLERNKRRIHTAVSRRDLLHLRKVKIRHIFRADISFRSPGRAQRHITNRLDIVSHKIIKEFLLLEAYMQFQFAGCRFDLHQRKHSLQLGNSHIGNTNITDHALFHQGFTLTVGIHKLFHTERSGIRIS